MERNKSIRKYFKVLEENLEPIEKKIKTFSIQSKLVPPEFLEPELRRFINTRLVSGPERIDDRFFDYAVKELEQDYLCYFETEKYKAILYPTTWWKFTYAGCNGQIERFLMENGLDEALQKLGFTEQFNPVCEIAKDELPEDILRYLIGIGYLYPAGENVIIHPNMLVGQQRRVVYSADSPFLSRDLIRCPYHIASDPYEEPWLSDAELWQYWYDLVALTFGGLPEYTFYRTKYLKDPSSIRNKDISYHLNLGKKLVPKRYVTLEAEMEKFEWHFPKD